MNVLIVDDDPHFAELVSNMLAGEGLMPSVLTDRELVMAVMAVAPPSVLLLNAMMEGRPADDLLAATRGLEDGAGIEIYLIAPNADFDARGWVKRFGIRKVFVRPFSLLDLIAALRGEKESVVASVVEPEPARPTRTPLPAQLDDSNLQAIVRLWARRANGIVSLEGPQGAAWVSFANGGPVDPEGLDALTVGLGAGELNFQPCDVEGRGLDERLGELLWRAAWESTGLTGPGDDFVPTRTRLTEASEQLPLPPAVRGVMRGLSSGVPLSAIVERHGVSADDARRGFIALQRLGMVHLNESKPPPRAQPAPSARLSVPEPDIPLRATRDPQQIRRLRRELQLLKDSDPWVVLGIPRNSPPEIIGRAGLRMSQRYTELAQDGNPLVRELATSVLERVEWAIISVNNAGPTSRAPTPALSTEEEAFQNGKRAMKYGDWPLADRWFTVAHERNLDSARNLSHLGWARLHNPDLPMQERVTEGIDYLLLAEQIDADQSDAQYFLASALHRQGDDEGALKRVRRALKIEPEHVAAAALARKLRRAAQQPSE